MQAKIKQKIIKQYRRNKLNRLTLISSLTMLSLGAGITLSSQQVRADQVSTADSTIQSSNSGKASTQSVNSANTSSAQSSSVTSQNNDTEITTNSTKQNSANTSATTVVDSSSSSIPSSDFDSSTIMSDTSSSVSFSASSTSNTTNSQSSQATASSAVSSIIDNESESDSDSTSINQDTVKTPSMSNEQTTNNSVSTQKIGSVSPEFAVTTLLAKTEPDSIEIGDNLYTQADTVDISSYQYWLTLDDFKKLKSLGIKSVIVKITQGTSYSNSYSSQQISLAEQAGLSVSVYHYATFSDSNSGYAQGQYAAITMKSLGLSNKTLIFADMEDSKTLSPTVQAGLYSFWDALSNAGFVNHAVYTFASYAYLNQVTATVDNARTWIAQYPYTPLRGGSYENEWGTDGYGGWQFSSTAHLPGRESMGTLDVSHDYNGLLTNYNIGTVANVQIINNTVQVSGWHIANLSDVEPYAFIIMYDSTTGHEITRVSYTPSQRFDLYNTYKNIASSADSGFNTVLTIPSEYQFGGKNIQFILRYSDDINGNGNYTDIWSRTYTFSNNVGYVDSFSLGANNTLHVSGWHAADTSTILKNAFLIVYDDTTGKEITRVRYTPTSRPDVAKNGYGYIYDASQSGFSTTINLGSYLVNGHKLQVVMRYSDSSTGEGEHTDVWSNSYTMANASAGYVDSLSLGANNTLHVSGWHAADASTILKNAFLIVYDDTTG
ncbi:GH25 family lysozyme, partial [Liquorilactobacillus sp.]|uniref:GH25 family lysozyme n=1 Tax=Liquorilactobacillus sp. TaxID=2767923 RepID=UPI0039E95340